MGKERKGYRFGLGAKLNIMLIASILLISLGLLYITYTVYCRKVDSLYFGRVERAASAYGETDVPVEYISHLLEVTDTDEFRDVHARAVAANDENIIYDWMREQASTDYEEEYFKSDNPILDADGYSFYSLYYNFKVLADDLRHIKELFGLYSVYLQYYKDGKTYTLVDPEEGVMAIGVAEEPIEAFSQYVGNVNIPPTLYRFHGQWLCTACNPIMDLWHGQDVVVGMVCADLDMNEVMRERHWFLVNSMVFIAILILVVIAVSLLLTRKLATKPLKQLAQGAMGFASAGDGFSRDDVIDLPIRSNDEIGGLYQEIRSMQERILDSANKLTHITAERERINTELRMATEIQSAMLPSVFPPFPGRRDFDLYASMEPAKEVGGDFYDFFLIDDDHLCLLIADVSDKGVPAALFMMATKILINYRAQMGGTPGEILTAVNGQISKDNKSRMFVTVWMGILDVNTGVLTCTNAGHEFPVIRSGDGVFRVLKDKHDVMVGVMPGAKYSDYELKLEPGDALFVYTDGLPEANNAAGEMFGMQRLEDTLNRLAGESPEGILRGMHADVNAFVAGAKQFDDLTMLCLEYRGQGR